MKLILIFFLLTLSSLATGKPQADRHSRSLPHENATADGYRSICFTIGQGHECGDKYSGGLGTYTMKHIPLAVYAREVNKTFFVYGGAPKDDELYLQCMVGCYNHTTGSERNHGYVRRPRD
ncbi:MAG: hypothetical protein IJ721_05230 [Bacteroidales bacterium]|nr:hypothetical protein [Bacteroidales bacterium]